ncbi:MAG: substrate-binding domain-containing protein [Firmicutes bacterium]|nr:substrate-binding domain-containing protein [Bacillota bacterium]
MNLRMLSFVRHRKALVMLCVISVLLFSLCGCDGDRTKTYAKDNEALAALGEIHLIAREDGSGTRSAFAQLLGFDSAGESGASDLTADCAEIAESTIDVIAAVADMENSIGYVSLASAAENDDVKILSVDGYEAEESDYPLERTFYLAYVGKLDELQEDFLRYVTGEGQSIVAESYEAISKSQTFLSSNPSGTLIIGGSTSVAPLIEKLALCYMEINPNAEIVVKETDSTDGLTGAMNGTYDFGMSSRELESYETELLEKTSIAVDKIAVIVHKENALESISTDVLRAMYTGNITLWQDVVTYE